MIKRFIWKEGGLVSFRLKDDLFTVAQMLKNPYLMFFYLERPDGDFKGLDLNDIPVLFTVPVARDFLQKRAYEKISKGVTPKKDAELSELWIRPRSASQGPYPWRGGDLVKIDPEVGDLGMDNELVKADLDPKDPEDRKLMDRYEMTNIWTDNALVPRLVLCLKEGKNIDPLKEKIFFGKDPHGIIQ